MDRLTLSSQLSRRVDGEFHRLSTMEFQMAGQLPHQPQAIQLLTSFKDDNNFMHQCFLILGSDFFILSCVVLCSVNSVFIFHLYFYIYLHYVPA